MRGHTWHAKYMNMPKELLLIKTSQPKLGVDESKRILYLDLEVPITEYNERVIVTPTSHDEICRGKRKYIKIKSRLTNKTIYRLCCAESAIEFTDDYVALTFESIAKLGIKKEFQKESTMVEVSRSWWLPFFWHHPFHATRVSMRIGIISTILGLLSLL